MQINNYFQSREEITKDNYVFGYDLRELLNKKLDVVIVKNRRIYDLNKEIEDDIKEKIRQGIKEDIWVRGIIGAMAYRKDESYSYYAIRYKTNPLLELVEVKRTYIEVYMIEISIHKEGAPGGWNGLVYIKDEYNNKFCMDIYYEELWIS